MLIGLCGFKGCGKSTVAKMIESQLEFTRIPMAGPLKDMLKSMGLSENHVNGSDKETELDLLCGKSPRWAMQTLGTEWGRRLIGEDIWVNAWENKARIHNKVICDDIRFHNEVEKIRSMGGIIIRIFRDGKGADTAHESELYASTIQADYDIYNPEGNVNLAVQELTKLIQDLDANNG